MRSLSLRTMILSISIIVGCTGDAIFNDDTDDLDDEVDEAAVTSANWEDWAGGAVYAATDPFAEPFFDESAFLRISTQVEALALAEGLSASTQVEAASAQAETTQVEALAHAHADLEPAPKTATGLDAEVAAELVARNVDQYYAPAGCASVERDGSELLLTLSECRGPFDEASLDGTLRVTLSDDANRVDFELSSEGLLIDGIEATLSASGTYSAAGSSRTVEYSSQRFLGGPNSFSGKFKGTLAWTAGSICVTRNASGEVETTDRDLDVIVTGYARCARACPTAGVVRLEDDDEETTLTFDGGNRAMLVRANDDRDLIALDCE